MAGMFLKMINRYMVLYVAGLVEEERLRCENLMASDMTRDSWLGGRRSSVLFQATDVGKKRLFSSSFRHHWPCSDSSCQQVQ